MPLNTDTAHPLLQFQDLQYLQVGPLSGAVFAGQCVAIMGRSGTGKSVLLRMLADLIPHAGETLLDGQPCSSMVAICHTARFTG